ncbi:MAG: HAD hydrolase-like protein [Chloroflexota bacterium]
MGEFKLLVSDLAGTVLSDDGVVVGAFKEAFASHDIPYHDDELLGLRGASKRRVFRQFAERAGMNDPDGIASDALRSFNCALQAQYESGEISEVTGATAALTEMRDMGIALALTSGFDSSLIDIICNRLGWTDLFTAKIGSDQVTEGRPAPYLIFEAMARAGVHDVRRTIVTGDTPLDLQAGMNAGAGWVVGVLTGPHDIETLGATAHTHLLPDITGLPELVRRVTT